MNKKANLILNIIELSGMCLIGLCFLFALAIDLPIGSFNTIGHLGIIKNVILYSSLTIMALVVSIELFLFFNYKLKYKFMYILFLIMDLVIAFYLNKAITFIGVIIILGFCVLKLIYRLNNIQEIYIKDRFYDYCKLYHIPIKKEAKTRKARTTKVKEVVDSKNTASVSSKKKKAVAA